jgi:hypothetical protein
MGRRHVQEQYAQWACGSWQATLQAVVATLENSETLAKIGFVLGHPAVELGEAAALQLAADEDREAEKHWRLMRCILKNRSLAMNWHHSLPGVLAARP